MNLFDILAIIVCGVLLARGIWTGFIRQISFIAALALGYIAAGRLHGDFAPLLDPYIGNKQLSFLLTYFVLFLIVYIVVMLLGVLFRKVMHITFLGWFDRLLGGIFGFAKGAFIIHILFLFLAAVLSSSNTFLSQSFLYPYLKESTQILLGIVHGDEIRRGFIPKEPAIEGISGSIDLTPIIKPGKQIRRETKKEAGNHKLID